MSIVSGPSRLNLPNIITTITQHSRIKSLAETESRASAGASTVVLIISPTDQPSATELNQSTALMSSLRTSYVDVYFAYIAQNLTGFQSINSGNSGHSDLYLRTYSTSITLAMSIVDSLLIKRNIPRRIFGPQCSNSIAQVDFEDYVLPDRQSSYRIHPEYLSQQALVQVEFRNGAQGQLRVCSWREETSASQTCQYVAARGVYTVRLTTPCPSASTCSPAYFSVTALTTTNLCAGANCRFLHQVGYYVKQTGLRCI